MGDTGLVYGTSGSVPDCIPCCTNCCLPCTATGSRTSQQHLAAQQGMGATFNTPWTLNMVLRLVEALITYSLWQRATTAYLSLVHHAQTSAEPRGSDTFIFLSCLLGFFYIPPSLLFHCFSLLPSPRCLLGEMICKDCCFIVCK